MIIEPLKKKYREFLNHLVKIFLNNDIGEKQHHIKPEQFCFNEFNSEFKFSTQSEIPRLRCPLLLTRFSISLPLDSIS